MKFNYTTRKGRLRNIEKCFVILYHLLKARLGLALTLTLTALISPGLFAQSFITNAEQVGVDGTVYAAVSDGSKLYIGGNFTRVGERTPYGAITDGTTADVITGNPVPNDIVRICKSDGSGGFYISGDFTEIGGVSRAGLAHINSSGTVTSWNPSPNGAVSAMAVVGTTVYVGGSFTTVGGQNRSYLAAINSSGNATTWNPAPNSTITVLEADASYVYAAGNFTTIGGQSRSRLAEINPTSGGATSWNPSPSNAPFTLKKSGSTLYVGGSFTSIAGVSQDRIAAFDMSTGNLESWDPNPSGSVNDIEIYGTDVIVGGAFNAIGGAGRSRLAALDASTASATSWDPDFLNSVYDITIDGDILYVGGGFFGLSNQPRNHLAAFDMSSETLLDWNPGVNSIANGNVLDIAAGGGNVYVAGQFTGIGGERRLGLAAINLSDLTLDDFDVEVEGYYGRSSVYALELLNGTTLIVGGDFTTVAGSTRNYLATVSLSTELATSWSPVVNGDITKLLLDGNNLYAIGAFTYLEGSRNRAAVIDVTSGLLTSWDPNLNNKVNDLVVGDGSVFLTGQFTTAGGTARNRIVEVNDTDGAITSWDPNLNNTGHAITIGPDGNIYVGGDFTAVGSDTRQRLAAIDPSTGDATTWVSNTGGTVNTLSATDNLLYAGGSFTYTGGVSQRAAAALELTNGNASSWNPVMSLSGSSVQTLFIDDDQVFLFGSFSTALSTDVANGTALTRANDSPFDIILSNNSINENASKTSVGLLSTVDDAGDTHTYSLVEGDGDDNNGLFVINGTALNPKSPLDHETYPTASVRIRSTDQNGYYLEEIFSITINNVIESENDIIGFTLAGSTSPALIDAANHTVTVNMPPGTTVTSLQPVIKVNTSATFSPNTAQDYSTPVEYTVTAENGSNQIWTATVTTQYEGVYTVKTGGDFEDMGTACNSINTTGIAGDVTLELNGYVGGVSLLRYDGNTEHQLTIKPEEGAVDPELYQISIHGTDNVVIDGGGILEVIYGSSSGYAIWALENSNDPCVNLTIKNVTVKTPGTGMFLSSADGLLVDNNRVELNTSATLGTIIRGIDVTNSSSTVNDVTISNNQVDFGSDILSASQVIGISLGNALDGDLMIYNNVVSLMPTDATAFIAGMNLNPTSSESLMVYHNTVNLDIASPTEDPVQVGMRLVFSSVNDPSVSEICQNNIIQLGDVNTGTSIGLQYSISDTPLVSMDNNNIHNAGSTGTFFYASVNGTGYDDSNFESLEALIGNVTNEEVIFTDVANMDYSLSGSSLSDPALRGTPIGAVDEDILGISRSAVAPSKGAYESPNIIANITSFEFPNQIGDAVIDADNFTVTAEIDPLADLSAIEPTIEVSAGATIDPQSEVERDFSSSVTYTVTAEAANTQVWTVTIAHADTDAPEVSSLSPLDDDPGVSITNWTFTVTFNEDIVSGSGLISLKRSSDDVSITNATMNTSRTLITGDQLLIDFNADGGLNSFELDYETEYYIEIPSGAVEDLSGNSFAGIAKPDWSFTTEVEPDVTAPSVSSTNPAHEALDVDISTAYSVTFDEPVQKGVGNIYIKRVSDDLTLQGFNISVTEAVIIDDVLSFSTPTDLPYETAVYVTFDEGVIEDLAGNDLAAITDESIWSFTTEVAPDVTAPTISVTSPVHEAVGVDISTTFSVTFDEDVQKGTGNIYIKRVSDDLTLQGLNISAFEASVSGDVLTFSTAADLPYETEVYVTFDEGVIEDLSGNDLAAISDETTWSFTTMAEPDVTPPSIDTFNPTDGAASVNNGSSIVLTFSEPIQPTDYTNNYIRIRQVSNNATFHQIEPDDVSQVTIDGNVVTIVPSGGIIDVSDEVEVYVHWSTTPFEDLAGNDFNGLFSSSDYRFTVDNKAPEIQSLSPLDNATDISITHWVYTMTMDENVVMGSGTIGLKRSTDDVLITNALVGTSRVSFSGDQVTIDFNADGNVDSYVMPYSTEFYIEVPQGAFLDAAGNDFEGITTPDWTFTTEEEPDVTAPTIVSLTPTSSSTDVVIDPTYVIELNEPIKKGSGNIQVIRFSDGSFVQFDVQAANVVISGNTLTISPDDNSELMYSSFYYVFVPSGAILDMADNAFTELTGTSWNFTTEEEPVITWNGSSWSNGSGPSENDDVLINGNLTDLTGYSCNNLTINSGFALTIAATTWDVKGDLTCDGQLILQSGASLLTYEGNTVSDNINIRRNTRYADGKYSFVGTPVQSNAQMTASDLGQHVYTYDESASADLNDLVRWFAADAGDLLTPGVGYTQANQQFIEFIGRPNMGTITYSASFANDGWHLVSNPYPAAIDLDAFLDANTITTDAIYIWDDNGSNTGRGSSSDYIIVNKTAATDNNGPDNEARWNGHIGAMQGFFVQMDGSAGDIIFNENMRVSGFNADDNFFRKADQQLPIARINLTSSDGLFEQTVLGWNARVSDDEITEGYDARVYSENADYLLYTIKANEKLAIQTITSDKASIPLGFNAAEAGLFTIELDQAGSKGKSIWLYDSQTEELTDLTMESYTFNSTAGQFANRFELRTTSDVLSLEEEIFKVYVSGKVLHISGKRSAYYEIIDLSGNRVASAYVNGRSQLNLSNLSNGVYLITDGHKSTKFILK